MKSNLKLKRLYMKFNRKWFGSKLPSDCIVRFSKRSDMLDRLFEEFTGDADTGVILISNQLRKWPRTLKKVLLHEMVHFLLEHNGIYDRAPGGHGKPFDREMMKLAKKGAFHHLW